MLLRFIFSLLLIFSALISHQLYSAENLLDEFDCPRTLTKKIYLMENGVIHVDQCEDKNGLRQGLSRVVNLELNYAETLYQNIDGEFHGITKRFSQKGELNVESLYERGKLISEHYSLPYVKKLDNGRNR